LHLSSSAKQKSIKILSSLLIILWSRNFVCFNGYTHTHTERERERERESFDDASTKQKEEESASFCRRFCRGGEEKEGEDKE
jgi:hypothetical protein